MAVFAPGVLGNDDDPDNDPIVAVLVDNPFNGTVTLNSDGSFLYTPNPDFNGLDFFSYMATDGVLDSNVSTVTITVDPVPDAPVAVNDSYNVNQDSTLIEAAPGVLGNDGDVEGDVLTAALVSGVSNGNLSLNPDGSFSYTPDPE